MPKCRHMVRKDNFACSVDLGHILRATDISSAKPGGADKACTALSQHPKQEPSSERTVAEPSPSSFSGFDWSLDCHAVRTASRKCLLRSVSV